MSRNSRFRGTDDGGPEPKRCENADNEKNVLINSVKTKGISFRETSK